MAEEWYYTTDGQQTGPVPVTALREMAANGSLKPTDLVWKEGMSQWAPASCTRGLFPAPAVAPVEQVLPAARPVERRRGDEPPPDDYPRERRPHCRRPTPAGM